jgi:hypothetical protein
LDTGGATLRGTSLIKELGLGNVGGTKDVDEEDEL